MGLKRVVITGLGAVSPYGLGVDKLIEGAWAGKSTVKCMDEWRSIKGLASYLAAPVPFFQPKDYLPRIVRRTMGDMAVYASLAAREAVEDGRVSAEFLKSGDLGVVMSSTTGSPSTYEHLYEQFLPEKSIEAFTSGMFFKIMGHTCSANVVQSLGINGEQWSPSSACTSSTQAIGLGYILVRSGRQQAVLCGGSDETHHSVTMFFEVLRAASHKNNTPQKTPRPFDSERDGVVCGGGSGVLLLESLESAQKRDARIYGEIVGFGNVSDPVHIANPQVESMAKAMEKALNEAGVNGRDVDYINAHATGTIQGDQAEAEAVFKVAGKEVPVSSMKGHIGHTLAAAGSLESILTLEMMRRGEILPTLNLENVDQNCKQIKLVTTTTQKTIITAVKNSFALGGVNIALVFKKP